MHTSTELRREHFTITVAGRPADFETLFPGFTEEDRLGIVIGEDGAGAGASTVILAAVTAFYDRLRAAQDDFLAYPDFFAFHVGRRRGTLSKLDVWPKHKEVVVKPEAEKILEAINDRGVTRLLVGDAAEDGSEVHPEGKPAIHLEIRGYTRASAERRIKTALSYSPNGRVRDPDVTVTGSAQTESYVDAMLAGAAPEVRRARAAVRKGDRPVESYRRISVAQALQRLGYHMD